MRKTVYELCLKFRMDCAELLYDGESFYNRNIVDHLRITTDSIRITFERMRTARSEEYVYSERSTIRFQLYRAACYYLIVTGSLPEVETISLTWPGGAAELDKNLLINHWEHCDISVCWPKETAARCFSENGRITYIVMTYCLKAQLDLFSHDAFRAAWSALNGVYNHLIGEGRERDKLDALKKLLKNTELPETEKYTKTLDAEFWRHLQWYNYAQKIKFQALEPRVLGNEYKDRMIYQNLSRYLCAEYKKIKPQRGKEITTKTEKIAKTKEHQPREQIIFLVTEYCYMLRNRSFHAAKPYPIFFMKPSDRETEEQKLTKLLLLTIRDLMNRASQGDGSR